LATCYNRTMDKQTVYLQLKALEKELVDSFKEFREVYLAAVDPRKQLSNQEIYDKVQDEYKEYHEEVEKIKQKTIEIMKRIQRQHDYEEYQKILVNLGVKPKNAQPGASSSN